MSRNLLDRETSPYLQQHRHDPVHWRPWGDAAFTAAQDGNRPILLSIGYSACHWCHVMAKESFADPGTAELVNALFVPVKVDREERPDVDAVYQAALALATGRGGWPLTMFLTPYGEPFLGGTYFPKVARQGAPAFADVMRAARRTFAEAPDRLEANRVALLSALEGLSRQRPAAGLSLEESERAAQRLLAACDPVHGGIGTAPKFPQAPSMTLLWRVARRTGNAAMRDAVLLAARHMCAGGIYDHLGGGFHRYATDQAWKVPHFEKMLYDNGLLLDLLTLLWKETREPVFAARVAETASWCLREMALPEGGLACALDADSEGEEGTFYLWDEAEIDRLLGAGRVAFKAAYGVSAGGSWEGRNILAGGVGPLAGDEVGLAAMRGVLLEARATRPRPGRDGKVLADWSGLMIAALAHAGAAFAQPGWIAAAASTFAFIETRLGAGGRLRHSFHEGRAGAPGLLDDYAAMARAALALRQATGATRYLDVAIGWAEIAQRYHLDTKAGGYFTTASDAEALIVRLKTADDSSLPSGNGLLAEVLVTLHAITGEPAYGDRAEALIGAFGQERGQGVPRRATLLGAVERSHHAALVVIAATADEPATAALARVVHEAANPDALLLVLPPGAELPPGHPAAGKIALDDLPTAYLCVGSSCSLPMTEPSRLAFALDAAGRPARAAAGEATDPG